ncbi:hypothetical protein B0H66DRAFT_597805 [Apodospora peruviana]|uniref:Uncharacterized protein n=1 Tax=Apodospora peruviana TaxID=516989 RepID=A0AAE0IS28_9PEZI|nr:hypothetical protein B0H66DRAFT_597805 [Apodospora peruviana]
MVLAVGCAAGSMGWATGNVRGSAREVVVDAVGVGVEALEHATLAGFDDGSWMDHGGLAGVIVERCQSRATQTTPRRQGQEKFDAWKWTLSDNGRNERASGWLVIRVYLDPDYGSVQLVGVTPLRQLRRCLTAADFALNDLPELKDTATA